MYIEPFLGAGAVFLNQTQHTECYLNDINPDLINLYRFLQKEGPLFIRYAERWFQPLFNERQAYYDLRESFNQSRHPRKRAALFLYLNRHGYNGLCRYNRQGSFNVPFGAYKKPYFPQKELLYFHEKLQRAQLSCQDYSILLESAPAGSLIYCDPPYVPVSKTAQFTQYSQAGFSITEQRHLAYLAERAAKRGAHVVISNHDTPLTRELYANAKLSLLDVSRTISCDGKGRRAAKELVAYFSP